MMIASKKFMINSTLNAACNKKQAAISCLFYIKIIDWLGWPSANLWL